MMRRVFLVLAVVAALSLAVTVPASAQTWFQVRYWSTKAVFNFGGLTTDYTSNPVGFTVRHGFLNNDWALSLNYDSGSNTFNDPISTTNRWWNINLHRNFMMANGRVSVYAGYASALWDAPDLSQRFELTGARLGVDGRFVISGNWYVTGDFSYGPFGTASVNNYLGPGSATINASVTDARVGLGYMWGQWGVEGGYRWLTHNYTPGANSCPVSPCSDRWNGWYVGLNFMTP
jgi:hypothetical protein